MIYANLDDDFENVPDSAPFVKLEVVRPQLAFVYEACP